MARNEWDPEDVATMLDRDREATDRALKSEREQADQLSLTAVADEADEKVEAIRAESDTQASRIDAPDSFPVVVETLAEAADKLSEAADGLARAAHKLHDNGEAGTVQTLHEVARALEDVTGENAASAVATPVTITDEPEPVVAGQLAEVADRLGVVA